MRRQPPRSSSGGRGTTLDAHGLYERFGRSVFAVCLKILGNREEAEDVVQETFLNAWLALQRGVEPEAPQAWLFTIARNLCVSRGRASSARIQASPIDAVQDRLPARQGPADDLVELTLVLRGLPQRQRSAFLLYEIKGLSHSEVADELGISYAAAVALVFRARRTLGESLVDDGDAKRKPLRAPGLGSLVGIWKPALGGGSTFKVAAAAVCVAPLALVPLVGNERPSAGAGEASAAAVADPASVAHASATTRLPRRNVAATRSIDLVRARPAGGVTTAPANARVWGSQPDTEPTQSAGSSASEELPEPPPTSETIDERPPLTPVVSAPEAGETAGGQSAETGDTADEPDGEDGAPADPGSQGQGNGPPGDPGSQGQENGPPDDPGSQGYGSGPPDDQGTQGDQNRSPDPEKQDKDNDEEEPD